MPEFAHMVRAGGFLIGRDNQAQELPKNFAPLWEYSRQHFRATRACLMLSQDLRTVPYREYVVPFRQDRLNAVSVAFRPLLPESSGSVGLEIVSAGTEIVAHVLQPVGANSDGVVVFKLPNPLIGLAENWLLRVFVRAADSPVLVYELTRGALLRGQPRFFPFVSFS
jgi:hypothetical protein